jgi:hypothetical protein
MRRKAKQAEKMRVIKAGSGLEESPVGRSD